MMSEQQFLARWQQNQGQRLAQVTSMEEQRRAERQAIAGKWDQADALLLIESGWTQEKIAKKVKLSPQRVAQLLTFGRFISTSGRNDGTEAPRASIPSNLRERTFRRAWAKTPKKRSEDGKKYTEPERFELARAILEADVQLDPLGVTVVRDRVKVGELLAKNYTDTGWMTREQALADLEPQGVDEERLNTAMRLIRERNTHGCMVEEKTVKGKDLFRIRKLDIKPLIRSEKVQRFYEEASVLLKEAKDLANCNTNAISPQSILHRLVKIERLLKGLHEEMVND